MKKIAIIGPPGAGKSTLAKELGPILNIKVFHLDRMLWKPNWKRKDRDTRIDILQKLVREKQWIIEGTYLDSSECRLEAADTIIFLDIPSTLCLTRIIKRHHKDRGLSRRDIPEGCTDRLTMLRMLKVLAFPWGDQKKLEQKLLHYAPEKIIRLGSSKAVDEFLEKQKQNQSTHQAVPALARV